MLNTQELNPVLSSVRASQEPKIFGEFKIREISFLAIVAANNIENECIEKSLYSYLSILNISNFSEATRFSIDNQICVIVETRYSSAEAQLDLPKLLTDRELQIANLVAQGQPNKQIAKQLHISEWTIATPLRLIFAKLSVDSRDAMVYRCASWIKKLQILEIIEAQ